MTKQCYILTEEELKELLEKSIKYDILDNSDWLDEHIYHAIDSWRMECGNPDNDEEEAFDEEIDKKLLQYKQYGN